MARIRKNSAFGGWSDASAVGQPTPSGAVTHEAIELPPWLDSATAAHIRAFTTTLAHKVGEAQAVLLFGSVSRHEERPLDHSEPSDVDLLILVQAGTAPEQGQEQRQAVSEAQRAISELYIETLGTYEPPRDIQHVVCAWDFAGWDALFVENITLDGEALWTRRPLPDGLPAVLASVAVRTSL